MSKDKTTLMIEKAHEFGEQCVGNSYTKYKADNGFLAGAKWMQSEQLEELSQLKDAVRWRKVEEELPKGYLDVIVKYSKGVIIAHYDEKVKEWYTRHTSMGWLDSSVVEWLPLPIPNEERSEE